MQSNISITFLSEKDMENAKDLDWRYEHVGSGNLGFADKAKNRVFVRSGLDAEVTKYLIDHEISHLFEMNGTDEDEHGIRHKKDKGYRSDEEKVTPPSNVPGDTGHWETDKHQNTYWVSDNPITNAQLSAQRAEQNQSSGNWWQNSWDQLKPLVYYALSNLAGQYGGQAFGSLFGGGASAAGTMGGEALPVGAGISMEAGGIGSGIGGEVLSGALKSGAAPAIGQQTSSFMQGNSNDFMNALGKLFTGGSKGSSTYSPPSDNFQMPSQSQTQSQSSPSGSFGAGIPETPGYYGASGIESLTNSRGMGSQTQMPMNPGLGQAGISQAGQPMGMGFGQNPMNRMFQDQMTDPYSTGGGNLSF